MKILRAPLERLIDQYRFGAAGPDPNRLALLCAEGGSLSDPVGVATVTVVGAGAIDDTIRKFGSESWLTPGAASEGTQYVYVSDATIFQFAGEFTIQGWFLPLSFPDSYVDIFSSDGNGTGAWQLAIQASDGTLIYNGVGGLRTGSAGDIVTGVWQHVAMSRDASGTLRVFVNGVVKISQSTFGTLGLASPTAVAIGRGLNSDNGDFAGWWEDVEIRDDCLYPADTSFTPPSALCSTGPSDALFADVVALIRFNGADASTAINDVISGPSSWTVTGNAQLDTADKQFGSASLLLDGSGDWLERTDADFAFGTGDFTIECWGRLDSLSGNTFFFAWGGGWGAYQFNGIDWAVFDGVSTNPISGGTPDTSWHHVAVCRASGTMRMFIDGGLVGSVANTTDFSSTTIRIGAQPSGSGAMAGHVDEFRVTKAARYTAAFTPTSSRFPGDL